MSILYNVISYSLVNVFLGVLFALAGILLMFFIIRSWFSNRTFTPLNYIVGVLLFFFLSFQVVLLCGAVTVRSYVNDVEENVCGWINDKSGMLPVDEGKKVLADIQEKWPFVESIVGVADSGSVTLQSIVAYVSEVRAGIDRFIWRRVGWSILFVVVGTVATVRLMERGRRFCRSSYSRYGSSGSMHRGRTRYRKYDTF